MSQHCKKHRGKWRRRRRTVVDANVVRVVERQVEVLHDLGEPEALRVVDKVVRVRRLVRVGDIPDAREARRRAEELLEARGGCRRAIEELGVARDAPRVEVALQDLRALQIVRRARLDEEAVLVVEGEVVCGHSLVCNVPPVREVGERFRPDAGSAKTLNRSSRSTLEKETHAVLA